jgi:hypothetical protein
VVLYVDGAMLGPSGPATAAVSLTEELVRGSIEPRRPALSTESP